MAQVGQLQVGVETEKDPTDQLTRGLACFLIATRLRFKDARRITAEPVLDVVDGGFGLIEASLNDTKTSNTSAYIIRARVEGGRGPRPRPGWCALGWELA